MKRAVVLLALLCAAQAPAQEPRPPARDAELPAEPPAATLVYLPHEERMSVPVTIAGQTGFRFVVDTGAQRSVLANEVAKQLMLPPGRAVRLVSMSGVKLVPTARVPSLSAGPIGGHAIEAPLLAAADLGADGLLGIDALQGQSLAIDFTRQTMAVRRSSGRPAPLAVDEDEIVVTARSRFGQLVLTDASYRGQRVRVVIDTGSAITIGNSALRKLVSRQHEIKPIRARDVLGVWIEADYTQIKAVSLGQMTFRDMPVAFADVQPFRTFRLIDQPAILLGMDSLALFRRVDIDFAKRRIRFIRAQD